MALQSLGEGGEHDDLLTSGENVLDALLNRLVLGLVEGGPDLHEFGEELLVVGVRRIGGGVPTHEGQRTLDRRGAGRDIDGDPAPDLRRQV